MHISFANCVHRQVSAWFGLRATGTLLELTQTQQICPDTRLTRLLSLCVDVNVSIKDANSVGHILNVPMIHICIFQSRGTMEATDTCKGRWWDGSIKADKNLIMDRHLFVDQRHSL